MSDILFTPIQQATVSHDEIVKLYSFLTKSPAICIHQFETFVNSLHDNENIYLMTRKNNKLIGLGSLLIEAKLIHGISKVGHIEDIVISPEFQGNGYGKLLIEYLTNQAKEKGCYKVILNCVERLQPFYEKCGYTHKNIEMSKYF